MKWYMRLAFLVGISTFVENDDSLQHRSNELIIDEKTLNVKVGDVVRIIAPSCKYSDKNLPSIKAYIESLGLVAQISENIFTDDDPFYSNSDKFRANDLIDALTDENVKIIWCIRGCKDLGRGSIRLIPYLNVKLPAKLNQKIFIGYNDITVLHLYFQYRYGWQTIHGPTLDDIASGIYSPFSKSMMSLVDLIFERKNKICFQALKLNSIDATRIESKIVGGNSATVEQSVRTSWEVETKGRILFLEEVAENGDHIEKRLDYLKQTRIFNDVAAVVFGNFAEAEEDWLIDFVLKRFAKSVPFPVFRVHGIGHGKINYPLPLLTRCEITSVDGGVKYELCVENIRYDAMIDDHFTGKLNISTTIITIGLCLLGSFLLLNFHFQ